jgi:hypothetical protein
MLKKYNCFAIASISQLKKQNKMKDNYNYPKTLRSYN